jgi:hypothetical protein
VEASNIASFAALFEMTSEMGGGGAEEHLLPLEGAADYQREEEGAATYPARA